MIRRTMSRGALATALAGAVVASGLTFPQQAAAEVVYTAIPQSQLTAVEANSVEETGEGSNGPIELILDGDKDTYWHTKWSGEADQPPHSFVVSLGDEAVDLGRVDLTPRQSSNGSGRVHEYALNAIDTAECTADAFEGAEPVKTGSFDGLVAENKTVRQIVLDEPVSANCVQVVYESTWGGVQGSSDQSPAEVVGSLAEFNAYTVGEAGETEPGEIDVVVPEGAPEITDGVLTVRTHPDFPQVVDYRVDDSQLPGKFDGALDSITIDGTAQAVTVGTPEVSDAQVDYPLTFPDLPGVSMTARISVREQVLSYTLTDIVDPDETVGRIAIPNLDLVSVPGNDPASTVFAATMSVSRLQSGDKLLNVADSAETRGNAWTAVANTGELGAGFETNAIGDNTTSGGGGGTDRYSYAIKSIDGAKVGTVGPAQWTYRAGAVKTYDDGSGIGVDDDPTIQVKVTPDANADDQVDWQDAAIAARDILTPITGQEDVANHVVSRIPFNIVSQATHPFLRTLDDTKRIALATDNLGQQVLLKGYQAEGHDSAQGDYDGHYNERAGGLEDLKTLVEEGEDWNATFGIHVNATETYSEAYAFSEDLLHMPPRKAWGWMNQSYYMNNPKDLATGNVLDRMAELREEFPEDSNLNWLYWDVYYPRGWEGDRFSGELIDDGWRISSEWSDALPRYNTWAHWANEESYGGQTNKGINSQLVRFIQNSYRDTWNPDPMLGNPNVEEFEGWVGKVNYNPFILNVWQRNLPTKFLQTSDIMSWEDGRITFENGTVVTSDLDSIDGTTLPNDRTITYDGATVFDQGSYLLPWSDGGEDRLYYWNDTDEAATWTLTDAWSSQDQLTLFELTDTGREKVADIAVTDGTISLPATESNTAYVLYPTSEVPEAQAPDWGEGSDIEDPGFFSGTLDAYEQTGEADVVRTDRGNFQAELGAGESSISQEITLPAGDYSMWAWVEIEPGETREVQVSAEGDGIAPMHLQPGEDGRAVTTINDSGAINATASDEKLRTFFQRVPVRITTDGQPFTFEVLAGDGDAVVSVDDLRAVAQEAPVDPDPTDQTIVFEDFEDVDTGYWPFVTGRANTGGDARTQLAELHEPYSQSGWYGLTSNDASTAEEGEKYLDNVLDGQWSLLAHQENGGMILRTTSASVPLQQGHSYRLTMDYQAAYDGDYEMVLGRDVTSSSGWSESVDQTWPIAAARGAGWEDESGNPGPGTQQFVREFAVSGDDPTFLGVVKRGGNIQGDLVIDNFRVEDLGVRPMTTITGSPVASDEEGMFAMEVTTTVSLADGEATDVEHSLAGPEGWTITKQGEDAATVVDGENSSVQKWHVLIPQDGEADELVFTGSWTFDGEPGSAEETLTVDPGNFPLVNPIGGDELEVVDFSSEQTSGEPSPSGPAAAAIDGDPSTYWHTQWSPTAAKHPHHLTVGVKDALTCELTGFEYTARGSASNGRAKGYEIYVSDDGESWGDPVASGEFPTASPQVVHFDQPVDGRFVKFVQTSSQAGNDFGGAAEIRLGGACELQEPQISAATAGKKLVGDESFMWGSVDVADGTEIVGEVLEDGEWKQFGSASVTDGAFTIPMSELSAAGQYQVRARIGENVSEELTFERVARTNVDAVEYKIAGQTTNAWGTLRGDADVRTQVLINGRWVTSQSRSLEAGFFSIPLTYGENTPGSYQWRVVIEHADGLREISDAWTLNRVARPTAAHAGTKGVSERTYVWGSAQPEAPVWTEVRIGDRWVRSQSLEADANGGYRIELTYGRGASGSTTWRVATRLPDGQVAYSNAFTLHRR